MFPVFNVYKTCPVPKFKDSIGELCRRCSMNDPLITKDLVLVEAMTTYGTFLRECNLITKDPKAKAFVSFISRTEKSLS